MVGSPRRAGSWASVDCPDPGLPVTRKAAMGSVSQRRARYFRTIASQHAQHEMCAKRFDDPRCPTMRRQAARRTSRFWWIALAVVFVGGVVLWLAGVPWGAALPGLSLIGFVVV